MGLHLIMASLVLVPRTVRAVFPQAVNTHLMSGLFRHLTSIVYICREDTYLLCPWNADSLDIFWYLFPVNRALKSSFTVWTEVSAALTSDLCVMFSVCGCLISCFILNSCPHVSCFAFHFLLLCDFPSIFYVHLCLVCQSAIVYIVCVLPAVFSSVSASVLFPWACSCFFTCLHLGCFWFLFLAFRSCCLHLDPHNFWHCEFHGASVLNLWLQSWPQQGIVRCRLV